MSLLVTARELLWMSQELSEIKWGSKIHQTVAVQESPCASSEQKWRSICLSHAYYAPDLVLFAEPLQHNSTNSEAPTHAVSSSRVYLRPQAITQPHSNNSLLITRNQERSVCALNCRTSHCAKWRGARVNDTWLLGLICEEAAHQKLLHN
jgi:hypothetical protein